MAKRVVLTDHAREKMRVRNLHEAWVTAAALAPERIEPELRHAGAERRFLTIPEAGGRVLRVVCVETDAVIRIIPAMFDRGSGRKR